MIQKFDIDIYCREFCVCTGSTDAEMARYFDTDFKTDYFPTAAAISFRAWDKKIDGVQVYAVWFPSDKEKTYRTVSHEAFHIVSYLMQDMQVEYDANNNEAFAYAIGHIANCIRKTIKL